MLNIRQYWY